MVAVLGPRKYPPFGRISASAADVWIHVIVKRKLKLSVYPALRQLECEVAQGTVKVTGKVPSYFMKQMVQSLLLKVDGVNGIDNCVEVCVTSPAPEQSEPCPA